MFLKLTWTHIHISIAASILRPKTKQIPYSTHSRWHALIKCVQASKAAAAAAVVATTTTSTAAAAATVIWHIFLLRTEVCLRISIIPMCISCRNFSSGRASLRACACKCVWIFLDAIDAVAAAAVVVVVFEMFRWCVSAAAAAALQIDWKCKYMCACECVRVCERNMSLKKFELEWLDDRLYCILYALRT